MKLRIRGNSLRLRLTKSEVERIGEGGRVEESIIFAPGQRLTYALEAAADAARIEAGYRDGLITVRLPRTVATEWATTGQVSLEDEQVLTGAEGDGATLRLLVEKDFACLTERRGADDADTFPHPLEGTMRC